MDELGNEHAVDQHGVNRHGMARVLRLCGRVGPWVAVAYWLAFAAFYSWGGGGDDVRTFVTDAAYLPVDALAAAAAAAAAVTMHRRAGDERPIRRAWTLLAIAFGVRLCGDGAWWWLEAVRHEEPFPSVADAFLLGFVPLVLAGLLAFPVHRRTRGEQLRLWLDIAIVLVGAFMAVWYLVLGPTAQGGDGTLATLLSIAYPVGDLVLLFGVAAVVARGGRTGLRASTRGPLQLLMAGICCYVVGDLGFGYASLQGGFTGGSWPDLAFIGADCLYLAAATRQLALRGRPARRDGRDRRPRAALLANPLPYLGVTLGYGLLVWVGRDQSPYGLGGLLLSAVLITVLVLARQITVTRDNQQLARRFEEIAITDALTGLANRRRLFEVAESELAAMADRQQPVSVLLADVDHFKEINDELGHLAGDTVLAVVAQRLRSAIRAGDLAARYGGDEFVVVMPGLAGHDALDVAHRLSAACAEPIQTVAGDVRVTVSIGLADADSAGGIGVQHLLMRADQALYEVKRRGRDGVHLATA